MEFIVDQRKNDKFLVNLYKCVKSGLFYIEVREKVNPIDPLWVTKGIKKLEEAITEYIKTCDQWLREV